jgi:16S rRNA (guanine527-N7)-methyltransferase
MHSDMLSNELLDHQITRLLEPYLFTPDTTFCDRTRAYIDLLLKWNRTISLTTVVDSAKIVEFHFGESLFALSSGMFQFGRLADVGSGAGFPGIALAMASPRLSVHLVESNSKKCAFLAEAIRTLTLNNCHVVRSRFEDLEPVEDPLADSDYVTSRALGQFDSLLKWSKVVLSPSGKLALWLGESDMKSVSKAPGWSFADKSLIPKSERRYILIGAPS